MSRLLHSDDSGFKAAQPGATDNLGCVETAREDGRFRSSPRRCLSFIVRQDMRLLRLLCAIPVSAIFGVVVGVLWSGWFPSAYYSEDSIVASVVGLAPSFVGRVLPVALFVVASSMLFPARRLRTIVIFSVLGGIYGCPFGSIYELPNSRVFYSTEIAGSIVGAATGCWIAASLLGRARRKKAAEPGATDNPDDAQRLREDH